ncbi:M16 family metallopeptidase [Synechocystis sp. PCC 7509]|uniref:M16 family metallopeptidase n=1 Tax=Synechocystis sp. PCC 7509 TaxID=927677 RepID=UPI0002AC85B9|nr:pitrilysin family protein [Synechocystis sp. PCC 7509]
MQLLTAPVPTANFLKLDNGLNVIHQYINTTSVVVADVWVNAGAVQEPKNWSGMAHFLEHMIFKGTAAISPGEFDRVIENKGGMTNAATSHDYAHYFLTTATAYLADTLPYLADLLLNATIPEDEFDKERDVVLEEIHSCYDDPDWIGFQALSESVYQHHPYGRSVLGTANNLLQHSVAAMRSFHHTYYQPENMTVVVVGGVEQDRAVEMISNSFERKSKLVIEPCDRPEVKLGEYLLAGVRRQEIKLPNLEQARLMMAWIGPGVDQFRHAYGLDLLSVILAGGRSCRLVKELREERQLVQGINCDFSLQKDSSLFTITAWLDTNQLERVEFLIRTCLEELQNIPICLSELDRCKRLMCNDYTFYTETPSQIAGLYGYYSTIATPELALRYPQEVKSFQPEELQLLARQYLSPSQYAVTVLKPC